MKCRRQPGSRGKQWWHCDHCNQSWNERDTGDAWRPYTCPERKDKEGNASEEAYRHSNNHNGPNR
jgi:hypothetical protein